MALNTHIANVFLPGCFGPVRREVVLIEDADAELDALREALSEIIVKVQESRSETRRLNWIEGRAQSALEGKPWVKGVFQMPDPKNGKPKEERLSRQLAALREELASLWETVNNTIAKLGIDCVAAQSAPGKPSDVLVAHVDSLQQRLTAAEQRNVTLREALEDLLKGSGGPSLRLIDELLAKPTESGASV